MANDVSLTQLANLQNDTTATNAINANSAAITTAFLNTLALDGTSPNAMQYQLDMNSNQIINLPAPATANSPARLQDLSTLNGGGIVTNIPAGGTTGQVLAKVNSTNYDVQWQDQNTDLTAGSNIVLTGTTPTTISTSESPNFTTSVTTPAITTSAISGGSSTNSTLSIKSTTNTNPSGDSITVNTDTLNVFPGGSNTVNSLIVGNAGYSTGQLFLGNVNGGYANILSPSTGSGTMTLQTGTDTLVGRNTTDTLTNKTITSPKINAITGGTAANSTLTLESTNNGSPSGDYIAYIGGQHSFQPSVSSNNTNVVIGQTSVSSGVLYLQSVGGASVSLIAPSTGSGALSLQAATDTIVCRNTTDTLTNKTLTSPVLTTPSISGAVSSGVLSASATAGIGYSTGGGAGGSVTQATSKSTGVTLNHVTGQITMNNAALATVTNVVFTLTNSAIAATDTIIVNLHGGNATSGTYQVWAEGIGTGTCNIVVRNISAGSLSEALVLNFNVIKGSAT